MGRRGKEINGNGRLSSEKSIHTTNSTLDNVRESSVSTVPCREYNANLAESARAQLSFMPTRYIAGPIGECHEPRRYVRLLCLHFPCRCGCDKNEFLCR